MLPTTGGKQANPGARSGFPVQQFHFEKKTFLVHFLPSPGSSSSLKIGSNGCSIGVELSIGVAPPAVHNGCPEVGLNFIKHWGFLTHIVEFLPISEVVSMVVDGVCCGGKTGGEVEIGKQRTISPK